MGLGSPDGQWKLTCSISSNHPPVRVPLPLESHQAKLQPAGPELPGPESPSIPESRVRGQPGAATCVLCLYKAPSRPRAVPAPGPLPLHAPALGQACQPLGAGPAFWFSWHAVGSFNKEELRALRTSPQNSSWKWPGLWLVPRSGAAASRPRRREQGVASHPGWGSHGSLWVKKRPQAGTGSLTLPLQGWEPQAGSLATPGVHCWPL